MRINMHQNIHWWAPKPTDLVLKGRHLGSMSVPLWHLTPILLAKHETEAHAWNTASLTLNHPLKKDSNMCSRWCTKYECGLSDLSGILVMQDSKRLTWRLRLKDILCRRLRHASVGFWIRLFFWQTYFTQETDLQVFPIIPSENERFKPIFYILINKHKDILKRRYL